MFKLVVLVCAQALIQSISGQCIGPYNGLDYAAGYGLAGDYAPWGCGNIAPIGLYESGPLCNGLGPAALAASNGAGLAVTSASPIAPTGVFMTSENCYEGPLSVVGAIPFLGAVAVEGALPTVGGGAVTYSCGNGNVAILNEDIAPLAGPIGFGAYGYDGLAGPIGVGAYGYDGLAGPIGFGAYGYDGLAGPIGFGAYGYDGLAGPIGFGAYGYDGLAGPIGFGAYGYDGLAGPIGFGAYGYDGLAGPYGCAGTYGYDGLGYGYGLNGYGRGCGGALI